MDCCFNENNFNDTLLIQLKEKVSELLNDTKSRLLKQDGKIAEMCNHIKTNLSDSLGEMFNSMKLSGELSDVISDVVLADMVDRIEKTNVFYDEASTSKIWDDVSSTYYYLTKIPRHDKNGMMIPLQMGIANDDETCSSVESTLKHAWRKNTTVCINCGIYNTETLKPIASVIYKGKILHRAIPSETPEKYQYFAITKKNTYRVYPIGTTPESMLADGVWYASPIFTSLIVDGIPVTQTDSRVEPRQSIGFTANNDVIIISCDGRNYESQGMTYNDLARLHALNGSVNAYILDGGGSTSTVVKGVKQNENVDNFTTDRSVGTFLYVARDTNVSVENNYGNDLGRIKHFLINEINTKINFYQGYLRLLGKEKYYSPGIEFYVNGENSRRSKLALSYDPNNVRNTYLYWGIKAENTEKTNLFRVYDSGCLIANYSGTSSERPSAPLGACYFDKTLNKPIWYDGTKWVDSTGTEV